MLQLPHVAELVSDEVVVPEQRARAQEDGEVQRVAVEAAKPRQAVEPGRDEEADVSDPHRPRIEVEPVEALFRAFERVHHARLAGHP